MEIYRKIWTAVCGALLAVGAGISFFVLPPAGLLWTGILAAVAAVAGVVGFPFRTSRPQEGLLRPAAARAALIAVGVVGAAGLTVFLGAVLVPLVLVAAATSPQAISLVLRLTGILRPHQGPPSTDRERLTEPSAITQDSRRNLPGLPDQVQELSDAELCRTWRSTYLVVIQAATPTELNRLYAVRRNCLDELQRRNPAAFKAWIDSGARASGDPEKFLSHNPYNNRKDAA